MDTVVTFTGNPKTIEIPTANIRIVNEDGGDIVYYNIIDNQGVIQQPTAVDENLEQNQLLHAQTDLQYNEKGVNDETTNLIDNWDSEMYLTTQAGAEVTSKETSDNNKPIDDPGQLHVCPKCNASFATSRYLKTHLKRKCVRAKNVDNPVQCEYCPSSFKMKFQLNRHMMLHTGERPFKCESCPKTFLTKSHLKRHAVIHLPKDQLAHKCERCDKVFAWASSLESHMKSHLGEKRFKCGICGRVFLHLNSLRSHTTNRHTVNGKFTCVVCKSCFEEATELILHMKTHSEQQSVKCDRCYAFFTSLNDLETHICTNFGGKPLICVACYCECQDTNEYCNHGCMQTNTNRKCGCCSKTFKSLWHLREHLITHTGEKPFRCEHCQKTFRRKRELEIHVTRHNTDKPFSCQICLQTFTSENYLKQHQRNEHREKKFVCEVCDHAFMHQCSLTNHMSFHVRTGNRKFGKKYHRNDNVLIKELVDKRLAREKILEGNTTTSKNNRNSGNANNCNGDNEIYIKDEKPNTPLQTDSRIKESSEDINLTIETPMPGNTQSIVDQSSDSVPDIPVSINDGVMTKDEFSKAVIEPKIPLRNAEQDPSNITTIYETHDNGHITIRCASCLQEFQTQSALLRHRKEAHHEGKPYQCGLCSRSFSVAANLSQHHSIHNVKRKYSCNKCGKSYKVTYKLREHLRVKHLENTDELTDLELQLRSCANPIGAPSMTEDEITPDDLLTDHQLDNTALATGVEDISSHKDTLKTVYQFGNVNSAMEAVDNTQQEQATLNVLQAAFNPTDLQSSKNMLSNIVIVSANPTSSSGLQNTDQPPKSSDVAFLMNLSTLNTLINQS